MITSLKCMFQKCGAGVYTLEHSAGGVVYSCDKCGGVFCDLHIGTIVGSPEKYCRNCETVQVIPKPPEKVKKRNFLQHVVMEENF